MIARRLSPDRFARAAFATLHVGEELGEMRLGIG